MKWKIYQVNKKMFSLHGGVVVLHLFHILRVVNSTPAVGPVLLAKDERVKHFQAADYGPIMWLPPLRSKIVLT